ncbi:MAG TPA: PDZ domain-containing protein [Pirellulaceae bacterium]|nr:PDZ domain-containing protein [Pirellulaceae bacterium]
MLSTRLSTATSFAALSLASLLSLVLTATAAAQGDVNEQEEQAIRAAVSRVAPSVVRIETIGGLEKVGNLLVGTGPTTGLVIDPDGYIVSSAFNFVQQPTSILVTLGDGKRAAAEIVARDHSRMLVLLKVSAPVKLPTPVAVPREEMVPGQWTIAIGRTFEQTEPSVSAGILSATNRIWGKAIQTDAKISPGNYGGPLVDIRGRVFGVLAPLAAQSQGDQPELAGAELYDSGIGFAVPLVDILARLDRLKKGEDLRPGLLGISLKGQDNNSDQAIIGQVQVKSPASIAGLKVDDKIVELAGAKVDRLGMLRHALGRHYAGEKVKVAVMRGDQRVEAELELAAKIDPYQNPFLGVLPRRDVGDKPGVVVRWVYPSSGADKAGLKPGDRITNCGDKPVTDYKSLNEALAAHEAGAKITLGFARGDQMQTAVVDAGTLPTDLPGTLPAARDLKGAAPGDKPAIGVVPIKIAEMPNECSAFVPDNYDPRASYGIVVWIHAPGDQDSQKLFDAWKKHCADHDLIMLAPKSADANRWQPTEIEFVRKAIEEVVTRYSIDKSRIVSCGYQGGAAMAYLVGLSRRDLVRGIVAIDSPPPLRIPAVENDPFQRLAIYNAVDGKSRLLPGIEAALKKFGELKIPTTLKKLPEARDLNDDERAELVRWIDSLDRL